jgi:hypothetical protein
MRCSAARRKEVHAVHTRDNDGISMGSGMNQHGIQPGCLEHVRRSKTYDNGENISGCG